MPDILLIKDGNVLRPATSEAIGQVERLRDGEMYSAKVAFKRNGKFFRKWFVLLEYAFGLLQERCPETEYKGMLVKLDFERFRYDVTIMAGFCRPVFNAQMQMRLVPESVSFDSMSDERFAHLYDATLNVLIEKVLKIDRLTKEQLDAAVNHLLRFS